jgi:hypothetical protein
VILLETPPCFGSLTTPAQLSSAATEPMHRSDRNRGLAISAITLWEPAWLASHGRLDALGTVDAFVRKSLCEPRSGRSRRRLPSLRVDFRQPTQETPATASSQPLRWPRESPGLQRTGKSEVTEPPERFGKKMMQRCFRSAYRWPFRLAILECGAASTRDGR